jgi:hypothetical protein
MKKLLLAITLTIGVLCAMLAAPAAATHPPTLNTWYGQAYVTPQYNNVQMTSATVRGDLLDKTDGHCASLDVRAVLRDSGGSIYKGTVKRIVTNCSTTTWAYRSEGFNVTPGVNRIITGFEARICQTTSTGVTSGVCTQWFRV